MPAGVWFEQTKSTRRCLVGEIRVTGTRQEINRELF